MNLSKININSSLDEELVEKEEQRATKMAEDDKSVDSPPKHNQESNSMKNVCKQKHPISFKSKSKIKLPISLTKNEKN